MKTSVKNLWIVTCCVAAMVFSSLSYASTQNQPINSEARKQITRYFKKSLPSLKIDSIKPTPIDGLYQVLSGPVVMYVTKDGKYAISGDILDLMDGETNITELTRQQALIDAFDNLSEKNMIVYSPMKPKYTVTVFTDIDCVYCRKFHAEIKKINELGIKVRYIAFPRSGKESTTYTKSKSVWCAADRKAAFDQATEGRTITPKECTNSKLNEQFHLGVMAGVSGTPTIVVEGKVVSGYFAPDRLLEIAKTITEENNPNKKPTKKSTRRKG